MADAAKPTEKPVEAVSDAQVAPTSTTADSTTTTPAAAAAATTTETAAVPASTTAETDAGVLPLTEPEQPAPAIEASKDTPAVKEAAADTPADAALPAGVVPVTEATPQEAPKQEEATAAAADAAPTTTTETPAETPKQPESIPAEGGWPEIQASSPLHKLLTDLPSILKDADYDEVYGLTIGGSNTFHTKLILQKFLRANANDLAKAKEQLLATLKWRKEYQPLKAVEESFSKEKFGGLGHVIQADDVPGEPDKKAIVTFNLYGAVKDNKATFGDFDSFLRWRVALMELGLSKLGLATATAPIPDHGAGLDPYQGYQVHDYNSVSFLRQDPDVKAASKKTIETFSKYYPETLSRKFFVNVPIIMGWMFSAMKLLLSKETVRKFTVLTYGKDLHADLGPNVPEIYGGKAGALEEIGEGPKLE